MLELASYPVAHVPYDNQGAHEALSKSMQRGERLNVKFGADKEGYPYAWIETSKVSGYKYLINNTSLKMLMDYMSTNSIEDFGVNPMDVERLEEGERKDFPLNTLKQLVESGKQLQYVPLFRETSGFISAKANYKKGTIIFRLERTEELVDYLREKDQI